VVQPASETAGELIDARSGSLPVAAELPDSDALSDVSVTSPGTAREMSRSARDQSKRAAARSDTVCTRVLAAASKSAYGLSFAASAVAAAVWAVTWSSLAWRSLTELAVRT
jgi:hypothetical protein